MSRDVRSRFSRHRVARKALRLGALLPAALLLAGGCDGLLPSEDGIPTPADIRVINGAADAIRVRVDGELLGGATPAGSFSQHISLGEGANQVRVEPSGASALTGGVTVTLPASGLGSGLGPISILATSTVAGVIEATLVDDSEALGQPGKSRVRVIHGASAHRELDIWYSNTNSPTLQRLMTPMDYGDISAFVETAGGASWSIVVTPRMVPTPGEDPEAQAIASVTQLIGSQASLTLVVLEDVGGGVRIVQRPVP